MKTQLVVQLSRLLSGKHTGDTGLLALKSRLVKKYGYKYFQVMKTDNDLIFLGISYPLYVSTIYNMLGFEWTKALSQRKTSWSNGKGK